MKKLNAFAASVSAAAMLLGSLIFVACQDGNTNTETEATVTGITVNADSALTQFVEGTEFSADGIIVKAVYSDNSKKTVASKDYTVALASENLDENGKVKVSGADLTDHKESAKVTVTYSSFTATYDVTIAQAAKKIEISVDSDTVKTSYTVDDELDYTGISVKAYYTEEEGEEATDITSFVTFGATYTSGEESLGFTTEAEGTYKVTFTASYGSLSISAASAVEITVEETTDGEAPDLSSYYKYYLVTTDSECTTTKNFGDWSAGSTCTKNDDGTWTCTAADSMWGGNAGICAPITGFTAGTFAKYEYLVIATDITNFTSDGGTEGNAGYNVKIPDTQKNISDYAVSKGNKLTFYVPLSEFEASTKTATEFAFIFGGTGSLTVNEIYLASSVDPSTIKPTGISITASSTSVTAEATVTFTVIDSNYNDVTSDVIFTIEGEDATSSRIAGNVLIAGSASSSGGTVTVKATYTVDSEDFTATVTVTVLGSLTNEITALSFQVAYLAPGWNTVLLNNVTELEEASEYVSIDDTNKTVSYKLPGGLAEQWQAQLKIGTDADVSNGDSWYFSCKLSGVTGGYTIKLNNDESLINQQQGTIEDATAGVTVTLSGTASQDYTDLPIMFDFGTCSEGTVVISDIVFAITEKATESSADTVGSGSSETVSIE